MEIKGTRRLPASPEAVWAALDDPDVLRSAIPGCRSIARGASEGEYSLVIATEVGPFKATFTGQVRRVGAEPPRKATLSGEGRGRPSGAASGTAVVELMPDRGGTILSYAGSVSVGGRLGDVAADVLASRTGALADAFIAAVAEHLRKAGGGFVDRLDHTPAGVPLLGDEPSEDVVEDKVERAASAARAMEGRLEVAAGGGVLGGPYAWGVLALVILVAALAIMAGR